MDTSVEHGNGKSLYFWGKWELEWENKTCIYIHILYIYIVSNIWYIIYNKLYIYMGDWYGHHSRCSLSYGDGSKPKIPAWFYGVKTTVPSHPRWGVHGRFVLKVPETLQRFSVSSTPSAIILAFTAGRSDAALPFSTSSIAPISTLVTWGETRSNLRVISIWHQEGRKWGPSVMMFIYVQRFFFWIYQLYIATP